MCKPCVAAGRLRFLFWNLTPCVSNNNRKHLQLSQNQAVEKAEVKMQEAGASQANAAKLNYSSAVAHICMHLFFFALKRKNNRGHRNVFAKLLTLFINY